MSLSPTLRFDFTPSLDSAETNDGWGSATLFVNGAPYWYANTDSQPEPVSWTWIDLLEHVARNWTSLVSEQSYPFPWLVSSSEPRDVWSVAELRWARIDDDQADFEESILLAFDRRHNLAAAFKGLSLPSLGWLRNGNVVWISTEEKAPIRASYSECKDALISVCDAMADAFKDSSNPRVSDALALWHNRGTALKRDFLSVASGLPAQTMSALQGHKEAFGFWEVAANSEWEDGAVAEGELLAAARMTAGILSVEAMGNVLQVIRDVPRQSSTSLDEISAVVLAQLRKTSSMFAFQAGYLAAEIVRAKAPNHRGKYFDIADSLQRLNIEVKNIKMQATSIDAVAVWGSRGPCILLNEDREHMNSPERTRMTLAHELGHLVIDRQGGLPFCEVLGGNVDDFMESRANAFAAELLLPRSAVEQEWTLWRGPFHEFLSSLKQVFGVSKTVACAQIYNSRLFSRLDARDQNMVEHRLRVEDQLRSRQTVKVEATGKVI